MLLEVRERGWYWPAAHTSTMLRQISSALVATKVIMGVHYRTYSPSKLKAQKEHERIWLNPKSTHIRAYARRTQNENISTKTNISTGWEWTQTREPTATLTNLSLNQRRQSVHRRLTLFTLRVDPTPINTNNHLQRQGLVRESGCRDEAAVTDQVGVNVFLQDYLLVGWLVGW